MVSLPLPIINYLLEMTIQTHSPAYLLVSKEGYLQDWGGDLSIYGISNLQRGEMARHQIFFLEGLLPLDETELFLPYLKTEDHCCANVHLFSGLEGDWVLFLDTTLNEFQQSLLQQHCNNFSLLQTPETPLLNDRE